MNPALFPRHACNNSAVTESEELAGKAWVSLARCIRPQGRHGEVLAEILTDFPERFVSLRSAFLLQDSNLPPQPVEIQRSWLHKGRVVFQFAHVDSISAAEALRGAQLVIPAAERVALDSDSVYISDLVGCQLIDLHPAHHPVIGDILDVIQQHNTADLLVVRGADRTESWIPFAKAYLVRLDLAGRRLEMDLPPGLLDVNAPLSEEERRIRQDESDSQS